MQIEFKIDKAKWNYIKEKGLPQDDEWCIVVYEFDGEYDYHMGTYNEEEKNFYVDFGFGGSVVESDNVIAWAPLFENDDGYLKVER